MRTGIIFSFLLTGALQAAATPTLTQIMTFLHQFTIDWSYPNLKEFAKNINYTGFAPDVVGRLDVTGTFVGSELNTEYFFGLFSNVGQSSTTSLIGVPLNSSVAELVIQGNSLSASLIVNFNWTVTTVPLQFNLFIMLNDEGQITQYDAQLVRSSWIFPMLLPQLAPRLAQELNMSASTPVTELATLRASIDICSAHEQFCTGENQQYNSTSDCLSFIQNEVPLGDLWLAGQNTGICRYLHKAMVEFRPEVHCPHIGPTGGDMCVNHPYATLVEAQPFSQPFIQLPGGISLEDAQKLVLNNTTTCTEKAS